MDLCLYTDLVPDLSLDDALDTAVSLQPAAVEIAAGGQSSGPVPMTLARGAEQ